MIDFGLLTNYLREDGSHKALDKFGFHGNPVYGSIHGLEGFSLNRRDDLESLGYTLMELIDKDNIPWKNVLDIKQISEEKSQFLEKREVLDQYVIVREFIKKANSLEFDEKPGYRAFQRILVDLEEA